MIQKRSKWLRPDCASRHWRHRAVGSQRPPPTSGRPLVCARPSFTFPPHIERPRFDTRLLGGRGGYDRTRRRGGGWL